MRRTRRWRRPAFAGALALLALGLAEATARVGLRAIDGAWSGPAAWARDRQVAFSSGEEAAPAVDAPAETSGNVASTSGGIAPHPFFGFTRDPAMPNRWWDITGDGFFTRRQPRTEPSGPERFTVAVLGGSVANHFAFGGWDAFARSLAPALGLSRFAIRVESLAMGGYKQPQQMNILAFHLARGDRFDAVINLDGFNDVVLPIDNLRASAAPLYPVHWRDQIGALPDLEDQARLGEIRYLDRRRARRAVRWRGPLAWSGLGHLVWRLLDRPDANHQAELRTALAERRPGRAYASHGPLPDPDLPDGERLEDLVAFWQQCSRQMEAIARSHGVRYVHFLQPNQYLPGSKPLSPEERRRFYDPDKSHRPIIEHAYPLLRTAGAELAGDGIRFHDLSMLFADVEETLYNDDCCHFNPRGNALLGQAIGRLVVADLGDAID